MIPQVANEDVVAWITEHLDTDAPTARTVLEMEFEYLAGVGLAFHDCGLWTDQMCPHFSPRWYSRDQLDRMGRSGVVDLDSLASDAQRLAGISAELALAILDAEIEYLADRDLVDLEPPP